MNLTFVITRDFERTLTERTKSAFDTFFFKKINEEKVENFLMSRKTIYFITL